MDVVSSFRMDGFESLESVVTADVADSMIAEFQRSPEYEVRGRWERVQSTVSVYRIGDPWAVVSYLMPLCD